MTVALSASCTSKATTPTQLRPSALGSLQVGRGNLFTVGPNLEQDADLVSTLLVPEPSSFEVALAADFLLAPPFTQRGKGATDEDRLHAVTALHLTGQVDRVLADMIASKLKNFSRRMAHERAGGVPLGPGSWIGRDGSVTKTAANLPRSEYQCPMAFSRSTMTSKPIGGSGL